MIHYLLASFLSFVVFTSQLAGAQEFRGYKILKKENANVAKKYDNEEPPGTASADFYANGTQTDDQIHQIDSSWKKPELKQKFNMTRDLGTKIFSEGTGSRGGGSGLLVKNSDGQIEVQLLEIFRSENLTRYNQFFPIDPELKQIESSLPAEAATLQIFETVLDRITQVAPNLGAKILQIHKEEIPFQKWLPTHGDLPFIEDETKHPLEENQQKIQVAYRRMHLILYGTRAYAAMKPISRAALWLHEYLYALSSSEDSLRTQRAVSLFFSPEFLKIAKDQQKLTLLFNDLSLLHISRKSLVGSLPPGASISSRKLKENCGAMTELTATAMSPSAKITAFVNGRSYSLDLNRNEAMIVLSSVVWPKSFLSQTFPIFKYPGQHIVPDVVCFNRDFSKIVQTQSALMFSEEMFNATLAASVAEMRYHLALGRLAQAKEDDLDRSLLLKAYKDVSEAELQKLKADTDFLIQSMTPLGKNLSPKPLGDYAIDIQY